MLSRSSNYLRMMARSPEFLSSLLMTLSRRSVRLTMRENTYSKLASSWMSNLMSFNSDYRLMKCPNCSMIWPTFRWYKYTFLTYAKASWNFKSRRQSWLIWSIFSFDSVILRLASSMLFLARLMLSIWLRMDALASASSFACLFSYSRSLAANFSGLMKLLSLSSRSI